ncbi:MAG TPA: metallopeptidase family protein [Candidatus Saccharimonadales bacterium]|nr:metallopeptidase family protein [Candidatus Saccharimonadales bacterium]
MDISDDHFAALIAEVMDELPEKYTSALNNVAVTYADDPTPEQRVQMKLRNNQTLFGLYEGIPQTARGAGYNLVLPDKITIFKNPLLHASHDITELKAHVKHTLWHEIAHHFGLDHDRIHELEDNHRHE